MACNAAIAQAIPPSAGGNYVMRKQSIASGGQRASGGSFVLVGTVAQSEASPTPGSNGNERLIGGFHGPIQPRPDGIFGDGFEN